MSRTVAIICIVSQLIANYPRIIEVHGNNLNLGMYPDPGRRVLNRNQKTLGNSKCGTWYNYSFNVHVQAVSLNSTLHISATLVPS